MNEVFETAAWVTVGIVAGFGAVVLIAGLAIWAGVTAERWVRDRNAQATR